MKKTPKTRIITDGLEILNRRYLKNDPEMRRLLAEETEKFKMGQQIYDLRTQADLTQNQLAQMVGTTGSVISRLESADYDGHSLKMLGRIAAALGKRVEIRIVDA